MAVAERGVVRAVNAREWIQVDARPAYINRVKIVLPPDAGGDAGPIPIVGCPLSPQDPGCLPSTRDRPLAMGETDWIYGWHVVAAGSAGELGYPLVFGPAGEAIPLFPFEEEQPIDHVRIGPGPLSRCRLRG